MRDSVVPYDTGSLQSMKKYFGPKGHRYIAPMLRKAGSSKVCPTGTYPIGLPQ